MALWYLRASTTQIIHSLHPIILLILSYFILKEKYYPRYAVGIIMCLIGSTLIVSNEHKANSSSSSKENSFSDTLKGTQMIYVGLTTMSYSFIFILCFGGVVFKGGYLLMCMCHGIFFYFANITYNRALQLAPVSKIIIITFLQIVFVFILAHLFLNEYIFFSDILGAVIMFSYLIYNACYPIKDK